LTDFKHSRRSGNFLRNSAACWAQIGIHRRRSIECTLATGFFPHRRSREPALPIAFPHLPTDLSADLFRGMEVPPTSNLEGHSCFIYVCGLSAALTRRPFSKMRARWVVGKQSRSGRRLFPNQR
jgi:hypothetical protein